MKNLMLKLERLVPFLSLPRLSVPPGGPGRRLRPVAPEQLCPAAELSGVEVRKATLRDRSLRGARLYQVVLRELILESADLAGTVLSHCALQDCRLVESSLEGARWRIVAADRISLSRCNLEHVEWCGVSFREALFENCDLGSAQVLLSDGFGARMVSVNAAGACFHGVDMSYASLEGVDFTGADLRGCRFAHGTWRDVRLEGALVDDADFRGVRGLGREARVDLWRRGAAVWSGWSERASWFLVSRLRPAWTPIQVERIARRIALSVRLALSVVIVLLVVAAVHAGWVSPPPHGTTGTPGSDTAWLKRTATQEEIDRTRANLQRLREAIQAAHRTTARNGVARYPTGAELAGNRFDKDGDGPGTEMVELVPGGLPMNFLTDGEGVAPYCNEVPTQGTLSGDNTDWHYCASTGRIFACGGYTEVPTLEW